MEMLSAKRRYSERELVALISQFTLEVARCCEQNNPDNIERATLILDETLPVLMVQLADQPQESEGLIGSLAGCSFDDYLDDLRAWMRLKRKQLGI